MKQGYKFFIALTLATAATFRMKAQNDSLAKDSVCLTSALVEHPHIEEENQESAGFLDDESFADVSSWGEDETKEETPWENTQVGMEMIETWQRLQHQDGNLSELSLDDIDNLRKINETSHYAGALAEGLKNYIMDGEDMLRSNTDSLGLELEKSAKLEANGPGNKCYRWIKHILLGTNPIAWLDGDSAYEAEKYLDKSPNVVKTKTIFKNMDKLIPGGIAVFGRGPGAVDGHVLIGGKGRLDLIKDYITDWGRKYWYNPAYDISDVIRNANTSGTRNKGRGHYNPEPKIYYTANSTLSGVTILKVGYQYARENMSKLFISTQDVYQSILEINTKSAELIAQKILKEKENVDGFVPAKNQMAYHEYPAVPVRVPNPRGVRYTKTKTPTTQQLFSHVRGGKSRM